MAVDGELAAAQPDRSPPGGGRGGPEHDADAAGQRSSRELPAVSLHPRLLAQLHGDRHRRAPGELRRLGGSGGPRVEPPLRRPRRGRSGGARAHTDRHTRGRRSRADGGIPAVRTGRRSHRDLARRRPRSGGHAATRPPCRCGTEAGPSRSRPRTGSWPRTSGTAGADSGRRKPVGPPGLASGGSGPERLRTGATWQFGGQPVGPRSGASQSSIRSPGRCSSRITSSFR